MKNIIHLHEILLRSLAHIRRSELHLLKTREIAVREVDFGAAGREQLC